MRSVAGSGARSQRRGSRAPGNWHWTAFDALGCRSRRKVTAEGFADTGSGRHGYTLYGGMAELADAGDLKSLAFGRVGSSPTTPTKKASISWPFW